MTRTLCLSPRTAANNSEVEGDDRWISLNWKSLGGDDQEELSKLQQMVSRSTSYSSVQPTNAFAELSADEDDNDFQVSAMGQGEHASQELPVRWLCSGELICSVQFSSHTSVADLKAQVQEAAGVYPDEQRLLSCGQELTDGFLAQAAALQELTLVRVVRDLRMSNLAHFRPVKKFAELETGSFTKIKKLTSGINGDIFKYSWGPEGAGTVVAVKKLRDPELERIQGTETNEHQVHIKPSKNAPNSEDSLTEIGILSYLTKQPDMPMYLLRMLGCFSDSVNSTTWLVTEFAEGGELFDQVAEGGVSESMVREYTWQLLQAVSYLHRHHIAHRDISLENILLKDGMLRLMDFGMAVKSHTDSGVPVRFFRAVGKDFYRAPECYVPRLEQVRVVAPPAAEAGDVVCVEIDSGKYFCEIRLPSTVKPGRVCVADLWGYAAAPADMWAVGVCLFILAFKIPPWNEATLSDQAFNFLYSSGEGGIESMLRQWNKQPLCPEAMQLISSILKPESSKRPLAAEGLASRWFADMEHAEVPVHSQVF
mmetsp:Transcript_89702/g.155229  ORF Transcript_89702/g.155229 Transcript_89702/m.155229 type:complete len:538 (-) Transcript_89702:187-1800(-)